MPIRKGDLVRVEYAGKLDDGTVFDSSNGREPLEFTAGAGQVIPGFDKAVLGMNKGEEKEIAIEPEKAYGDVDPMLVRHLPRDNLPPNLEPKPGMVVGLHAPDGQQVPAKIIEVTNDEVVLDLNHPLAGKTLHFRIKVV